MVNDLFNMYATFMVNTFGYELAIRLEDIFYGVSMFILGGITMGFLTARFILRLD